MAIAFVQSVGTASSTTSGNTIQVFVPAGGVAVGDTLVLTVGYSGGTGLAHATAADNHAGSTNTYTSQVQVDDSSTTGTYAEIITCPVTTALVSGDLITVTLAASVTDRGLQIDEFSGVATVSPVDVTGSAGATAKGTASSASLTTTNATDVVIGTTTMVRGTTFTFTDTSSPGTWTSQQLAVGTARQLCRVYQIVSSTGTYTVSGTLSASEFWAVAIVALKAASSGITYNDSGSGTITLSGSSTELHSASDSGSGTIVLSGSQLESLSAVSSGSGTITLSGTAVESAGKGYVDSGVGTITLSSGAVLLSNSYLDAMSGSIVLSGSAAQTVSYLDTVSGLIVLSGSSVESWTGNINIPPFLEYWHTGLARLNNIEQWLDDNTSFIRYQYTGYSRVDNIEIYLRANPVLGSTFYDYHHAGTDRLWAIEEYLLRVTQSGG